MVLSDTARQSANHDRPSPWQRQGFPQTTYELNQFSTWDEIQARDGRGHDLKFVSSPKQKFKLADLHRLYNKLYWCPRVSTQHQRSGTLR
jgi:hypothetical protein